MATLSPFKTLRQPLLALTRAIPRQVTWVDPLVLAAVGAMVWGVTHFAGEWTGPHRPVVEIDLSIAVLPKYTFYSLMRGFAAFALSFFFTLVYGYVAAKNRAAERVLIPLLDILQSIPVLGFMPAVLLTLVAVFPHSNIGLELSSVIFIFTGQAWNMTFSFYHSLLNIPPELVEAAKLYRFGWWRTFSKLELPFSTVGLVWNGMMSMAGGWFFLSASEAMVLGDKDFRLPGIGSYMSVATDRGDTGAMFAAIVAMILMIVVVDQLFWRPLVAWSEKFNVGDVAATEAASSWVLDLLHKSGIIRAMRDLYQSMLPERARPEKAPAKHKLAPTRAESLLQIAIFGVFGLLALWGAVKLLDLLRQVSGKEWGNILGATGLTLVRTTLAVALGTLWTVPVGVAIGRNPKLSRVLQPVVQIAASFPANMIFPLVLASFGALGVGLNFSSVVLMMLGTQWYVLFNVIAGAMNIPHDLEEAAVVYQFSKAQLWKRLYLPGIFPQLVTGWVTAAGGAWNASIISEYVHYKGENHVAFGLGGVISQASAKGDMAVLAAGVVTMAIVVVGINRILWKRLYHLAELKYALSR
ncbi:MAG: ABC transporter permease subunit [Deltaproteobacteria bacterium]|nr:ABC transporter permease subunit [Deltaproteobacteria bacterium]